MFQKCFVKSLIVLLVVVCCTLNVNAQIYPMLKLDMGPTSAADRLEPGFKPFTPSSNGATIDGITIELTPLEADIIEWRWRGAPTGIEGEMIYRDFLFTRPGGLRITLSGLAPNTTYDIAIYAYDDGSASNRVADWTCGGELVLTTWFAAGVAPQDADDNLFYGLAQSDDAGRIILQSGPNPNTIEESGANNPYCFVNALVVSSLTPLTEARVPEPDDGAVHPSTDVTLSWLPGYYAVSHNVYFGDSFNDVSQGTGDTFKGSSSETSFLIEDLAPATTYYWRIDGVNDLHPESPWKGDVWSFTVPPKTAYDPVPVDGVLFIDPNFTVSWSVGADAIEHHVYFGENLQDVQNGTGDTDKGTTADPNFYPGVLKLDTTYYWRVDEYDGTDTHTGDVWSYTTTLEGLGAAIIEMWEGVSGDAVEDLTNSGNYPDNPTWTDEITQFDTMPDAGGLSYGSNYGAIIHGWLYVPMTGDYSFWLNSANQGELRLSTDDDSTNAQLIASEATWGWQYVFANKSDPIPLIGGNKYYIMAIWKQGALWDHCQVAWQGPGIREMEIIQGSFLSPYLPVTAYGPNPAPGSTDVKVDSLVLSWRSGKFAASHIVNFGTDPNALSQVATKERGDESYSHPTRLDFDQTYYWRIDGVNTLNPDSPWIGKLWSFSTGNFLVVDDFEDYNDSTEGAVWATWTGWEQADNGVYVGHEDPPYCEQTIVNSGRQSMPMDYNNTTAGLSEATRTLSSMRDWTQENRRVLSVWFRGYPPVYGSAAVEETAPDTYSATMTARGADIAGEADEFHFAYLTLTGVGSITARVISLEIEDPNLTINTWAKAGVMIRQTLEADSPFAAVYITPEEGCRFQARLNAGDAVTSDTEVATDEQMEITAPYWVHLEKNIAGDFSAYYSSDGSDWQLMVWSPQNIQMTSPYVGLALTSHATNATVEAVFDNITIQGNVSGEWTSQDIGIISNDPELMYLAVANNTGTPAVVYYEGDDPNVARDPNGTQIDTWEEWAIDLRDLEAQGVDLNDVNSITIGFGDRDNPQPSGSLGAMYFDDIYLYPTAGCFPTRSQPEADLNDDCVVDLLDVEMLAEDWLALDVAATDPAADLNGDDEVDFRDFAILADGWLEERVWPED